MPAKKRKQKTPAKKSKDRYSFKKILFNKISYSLALSVFLITSLYVVYLDIQITDKISGKIWSFPSSVYARPLELYKNKNIDVNDIVNELNSLDYVKVDSRPTKPGQYRVYNHSNIEFISRRFEFGEAEQLSRGVRLLINNGFVASIEELNSNKKLPVFRLEPIKIAGIYPKQKEERELIKLEDVPDDLILALLAVEDRRFYEHWGVDPISIARALGANLMAGKTVQGGSTLTQQLVKNIFLSPEQTLIRKINEAIMALLLEFHYDKSVILETYINEVYLGQSGSNQIHGFQLASHFYFSQPLQKIGRDQMALLVGLVKGPSWYEPRRNPARSKSRRNQVLELMLERGVLSKFQYNKYSAMPLGVSKKPKLSSNRYPALMGLVKSQLEEDYNDDDLKTAGLKIFTSIDPIIQDKAEASVVSIVPGLEANRSQTSELQAAVIIASSEQGEIQALVSDRNPKFSGFNRSLDAVRQIGSLIKPAIYLTALQRPDKYTLATMLKDEPLHIKTSKDNVWSPMNYDKQYLGDITLFEALKDSRNVPTVRLGLEVGLAGISDTLHNLGVTRNIPAYPSMTLGAFSLSPLDVANMYQTFAADGYHIPLRVIREVLNKDNEPLKRYPLTFSKSLDDKPVYLVNHTLQQITKTGTARRLAGSLTKQVAGKTGTTDDTRDSWFAGFSGEHLAVVWIGRDDNMSTGLTGSSGALRLWSDIMQNINTDDFAPDKPAGITEHWIDLKTGGLTDKSCQGAVKLPFITGSAPKEKATCTTGGFIDQLKRLFN